MSEAKFHSNDKALLSAASTGDGLVEITPDLLQQIGDGLQTRAVEDDALHAQLLAECPYETRLAITAWVFKHLVEHAADPGTFRYLIYDRLGFDVDAYVPLYRAGGMTISNDLEVGAPDQRDSLRAGLIALRHYVSFDDEADLTREEFEQLIARCDAAIAASGEST